MRVLFPPRLKQDKTTMFLVQGRQALLVAIVWAVVIGGGCVAHVVAEPRERAGGVFNVVHFGAVGDGTTKDTRAIRKAVAALKVAGNGTLLFPSGKHFLTAPFNLTSHCTVFIEKGARILGSTNKDDWPRLPPLPSYGEGKHKGPDRRMSLIHGEHLTDVVITGENGTIDCQGHVWWRNKTKGDTPPHVVELMWSTDVEISHLTIRNSPFWTVHPVYVTGFHAHHLWILNPTNVTTSDGIDPDSTRDVLIHDCYIVTGDDGIAIKSGWDEYGYQYGRPSENITIRDCNISTPCAALAIGSEMSGGVKNVHVSNCYIWDSTAAVHIKSGPGRGGYVRNITYEGLTMDNCHDGIMMDIDTGGHPPDDPTHHLNMSALPDIRNIAVRNVVGKRSTNIVKMVGLTKAPLRNIRLENLRFDGGDFICGNVSGVYQNVFPKPCSNFVPAGDA